MRRNCSGVRWAARKSRPSGLWEHLSKVLRKLAAEVVLLGCDGEAVGVDIAAEGGELGVDCPGGCCGSSPPVGGRGRFRGHLRDFADAVDERGEVLALVLSRGRRHA